MIAIVYAIVLFWISFMFGGAGHGWEAPAGAFWFCVLCVVTGFVLDSRYRAWRKLLGAICLTGMLLLDLLFLFQLTREEAWAHFTDFTRYSLSPITRILLSWVVRTWIVLVSLAHVGPLLCFLKRPDDLSHNDHLIRAK
jgi:hypothetical protein